LVNSPATPDVAEVAPKVMVRNVATVYGNSSHTTSVLIGTTPNYLEIDNDTVTAERDFTQADYATHRHLALIGASVAADLTGADPSTLIGHQLQSTGNRSWWPGYSGRRPTLDRRPALPNRRAGP
jgi:putative ABC transport system permease protein